VASYIAEHHALRVLLIDADPQCNATQLVLPEPEAIQLYQSEESGDHAVQTLRDVLQPIVEGDSFICETCVPQPGRNNRFGIDLLPGHPEMSMMEDRLSRAWLEFSGGEIGGARKTNWSTQLMSKVAEKYDLVFVDVGPSLGALNRSVLVGADYFVTPMGCDIFSVMGVRNIATWMSTWIGEYDNFLERTREKNSTATALDRYPLQLDSDEIARYAGYTVQQYITKKTGGVRRPTKAYEQLLERIPTAVWNNLHGLKAGNIGKDNLRLGDVPNMFSLVPLAQAANSPVHNVESADGLVGAQYSQKEDYVAFIRELSSSVLMNAEVKGNA